MYNHRVPNPSVNQIKEAISNAKNILQILHRSPDLDCICSNFALHSYLKSINKKHSVFCVDKVDHVFDLFKADFVQSPFDPATINFSDYDLIVGLDLATESIVSKDKAFKYPPHLKKINIDHHQGSSWGDINYVLNNRNSASSILYELLKEFNFNFDSTTLHALLLGYLADSGVFQYDLHAQDLRIAAELVDRGVNINKLIWYLNFNLEYKAFLRKRKVFDNTVLDNERNIAYSKISLEELTELGIDINGDTQLKGGDVEDIRKIKGINFAALFKEKPGNMVTVSFRSNNPDYDVSKIANYLGGGGHKNAAAAMLVDTSLDEAIKTTLKVIDRHTEHQVE